MIRVPVLPREPVQVNRDRSGKGPGAPRACRNVAVRVTDPGRGAETLLSGPGASDGLAVDVLVREHGAPVRVLRVTVEPDASGALRVAVNGVSYATIER